MKSVFPYVILFSLTLAFRIATALPLEQAGYMDASYAIHIAEQLARGRGFTEEVLWNYLDNPAGLPHPSNLYWMPLPALLIAPFFALLGVSYRVAQIPFVLLSSLLPLVAFYLSRKIFARDDYAWAAALFTTFSGFFTIYWVSPDNFAPFALTGSLCLYFVARGIERVGAEAPGSGGAGEFFTAGIFAGLSHLSRADGLLLLALPPLALLIRATCSLALQVEGTPHGSKFTLRVSRFAVSCLRLTAYCLLGYLLVMSPWFARNYLAIGTPLPSAGAKTMWLTNYDELFRLADDLTPARYLASGVGAILAGKANAALQNLFILAFSSLVLFLAPFALIGMWRSRQRIEFQVSGLYALLLYLVMTLAFTFPSWRGTLFHSMSALVPFFAVAVPPGLDAAIEWIARRRRAWNARQAARVFRFGFVVLAAFFSVYLYGNAVWGGMTGNPTEIPLWNQRHAAYPAIARWLDEHARPADWVIVVDPPTFYNASHRRAIVTPTDSVEAVLVAARQYGARYLVLEYDHPRPLRDLYRERIEVAGLARVAEFRDGLGKPTFLFEVSP